jgi:HEAT repeat protein
MKNELTRHDIAVRKDSRQALRSDARAAAWTTSRCVRLGLVGTLGASMALLMPERVPQAQTQRYTEPSVKVTGVTTSGNVVSISADGSLGRAQTWQDPEGFHVVLVNGQAAAGAAGAGVKARRVGNSLELVVPVRRGASVTVEPRGNRLDLVVSGGQPGALNVENFPVEQREAKPSQRASDTSAQGPREREHEESYAPQRRRNASEAAAQQQSPVPQRYAEPLQSAKPALVAGSSTTVTTQPQAGSPSDVVNISPPQQQPSNRYAEPSQQPAPETSNAAAAPAQLESSGGFNIWSFLTYLPALLVLLGALVAGAVFVFLRRRRDASEDESEPSSKRSKRSRAVESKHEETEAARPFHHTKGDRRKSSVTVPFERRTSGRGAEDEALRNQLDPNAKAPEGSERAHEVRPATPAPVVQFGAYRIDQEVACLVEGRPHSIEVIASRAADDRRAVETSLLKALRSPETDEDGRRRARMALEDYGFVARSCASLLLGTESFERASAARSLGEMRSAQALLFLTEALYDADPIVRNECVQGLGALGMPSAIGALLDVARRHPDIPAAVLGPALTACSVESLDVTWDVPADGRSFAEVNEGEVFSREIVGINSAESYEELPETVYDGKLTTALKRAEDGFADTRVQAAQQLAQFQVRRSVETLAALARHDSESSVRSAAVTSLGLINHESVFVHVIAALADEAREVRAAAARALSRLSFDRADAYVRVIEAGDADALRSVAQSCVKAGLAAQAISRLASEDRRQAYEAFSLLTLCAKAGEVQPILDTVECHRDIEVRLTCIRLLGLSYEPALGDHLVRIAGNGGVPERVRRAIVETVRSAGHPVPAEVSSAPAEVQAEPVGVHARPSEVQIVPVEVE